MVMSRDQLILGISTETSVALTPPGRVGGRPDPATVRPVARGVSADPEKVRSLLDPEIGISRL
jgi:hypothetical protein